MTSRPSSSSRALASRLRVSEADIEAWQQALARRSPRAPGRKLLALAFLALAAASMLWSRTASTAGCPDPTPALPSPLTKFCPDTPAYAEDMNQNFAQITTWLAKFAGPVGSLIGAGWVETKNIQAASINATHLADNAVQGSNIKDGSINGTHIVAGTIAKDRFSLAAPTPTTTLRKFNPACRALLANHIILDQPTCQAEICPGATCSSGQHFYQCDTTNCSSACSLVPPVCTNPIAGYLLP